MQSNRSKAILVVDDESDIRELVRYHLARDGYWVACAETGEEALKLVRHQPPDLIVLDLMLPGRDGLEICRQLKADPQTAAVRILILSAKSEDADIVAGLELGADDYVTKPFMPQVLVARVRAILRRRVNLIEAESDVLNHGELVIDPARYQVTVGTMPVNLTTMEMRMLIALARRPGLALTRFQLIAASQGEGVCVTDRSVDVHIAALRRKLGTCGSLIETVHGIGYRFKECNYRDATAPSPPEPGLLFDRE